MIGVAQVRPALLLSLAPGFGKRSDNFLDQSK
jgi:hypothetical protein